MVVASHSVLHSLHQSSPCWLPKSVHLVVKGEVGGGIAYTCELAVYYTSLCDSWRRSSTLSGCITVIKMNKCVHKMSTMDREDMLGEVCINSSVPLMQHKN